MMGLEAARIPNGWANTSLEAVCQILDSRRIPLNSSERSRRIAGKAADDLYPYYGATGQVGVIDDFIFDGEHILLGEDGAPFLDPFKVKSYLAGGKFWVNNHAHILKSTISNRYLCHYLNQIDYSDHVTGTTRLKLTQNALKRIPVLVAPTDERRRIVAKIDELFSELDKSIESLKTARANINVYRQAVLKHAFEGKLTAQWREENKDKLEKPEQLLARIKQERAARYEQQLEEWKVAAKSWGKTGKPGNKPTKPKKLQSISHLSSDTLDPLPKIPNGWTWLKLEDVCNRITDGEHFRPPVTNEGVYFLSAKDVREDGVSFDDALYINNETAEKALAKCNPEYGDLLMVSRGATVGRTCVVRTYEQFCLLGSVILISVCQKTPLSELSCHDPPHFPRQLQPNFVQEDASDRSGWGDWWWTGPDLRDAAIGRRSRLLGSGFKG